MWWMGRAVIAMVPSTGFGAKFFFFILVLNFSFFQQEGAEWGRTGRSAAK